MNDELYLFFFLFHIKLIFRKKEMNNSGCVTLSAFLPRNFERHQDTTYLCFIDFMQIWVGHTGRFL